MILLRKERRWSLTFTRVVPYDLCYIASEKVHNAPSHLKLSSSLHIHRARNASNRSVIAPTDTRTALRAARFFHRHAALAYSKLSSISKHTVRSQYATRLTGCPFSHLYQCPECVAIPLRPVSIACLINAISSAEISS
jgi:hypothetical protein